MLRNLTKAKLQAGETVLGCFVRYPSASFVEVLGYQGWDFLVLDGEHGTLTPEDCENMVRAAELRDVTPIIRVTTNQPPIILRFMDTGAQGLHVPWVNSAVEAEAAVRAVKYQPRGIRGLAGVRAADYGQASPLGEYVKQANEETLVVLQVESAEAVDQLPDIISTDGVDVVFIGPTDLSHSLGVPGQSDHPAVQEALERIVEIVEPSQAALGTMAVTQEAAKLWLDRGARYLTVTSESLVQRASHEYLRNVRASRRTIPS